MRPLNVLLVDDERSLLITLAANLELEGMNVATVENGQAALTLAAQQSFDLVLSDVRMPGMSGVDLSRALRKQNPDLPVLLMTALAMESMTNEALQTGVFALLPKPFSVEELAPLLRTAASHPTVLLIDGDLARGQAAATALQTSGVRCRALDDVNSVLAALETETVDVCVIDHNFAELATQGTPSLIEQMKRRVSHLSVIMLAGPEHVDSRQRGNSQDDITWLRKPTNTATLAKLIAAARGHRVTRR